MLFLQQQSLFSSAEWSSERGIEMRAVQEQLLIMRSRAQVKQKTTIRVQ